jgi:hypothetical protein
MKQFVPIAFALMIAATAPHVSTVLAAAAHARVASGTVALAKVAAGTVKVTLNYKGKGTVDESHKVWVWLFATPDIGPTAMPIAQLSIDKNGDVAAFDGVIEERVYVAAAFDQQGVMSGDGPPPQGSPIGILMGADGAPRGVAPGETAITLAFDDSIRMP